MLLYLHFSPFDIEAAYDFDYDTFEIDYNIISQCYDHLTITDIDGTSLMNETCGSLVPAPRVSKSNAVRLNFVSDFNSARTGWSIRWSAVTPGKCLLLDPLILRFS